MPITPSSGAISMNDVRTALGVTGSISLGSSGVRLYGFIPTGAVSMSNLYAMARDYYTAANTSQITMKTRASQLGWNGTAVLKFTLELASGAAINNGVLTGSTFPTGSKLQLLNGGIIRGESGIGVGGYYYDGGPGGAGSVALTMTYALTINNSAGIIGGGGGGGGGGAGDGFNWGGYVGGSGGYGAGGSIPSNSGFNGNASSTGLSGGTGGSAGQVGGNGTGSTSYPNGGGGGGGGLGAAGGSGGRSAFFLGGAGGAAGACTSGSATYATWVNTGTRYGTIG